MLEQLLVSQKTPKKFFLPSTACPGGVCGAAVGSERKPLGVQPARHVPLVSAHAGWPVPRIFQPRPACSLGVCWQDENWGWQGSGTLFHQRCLYLRVHKKLYQYISELNLFHKLTWVFTKSYLKDSTDYYKFSFVLCSYCFAPIWVLFPLISYLCILKK